MSKSNLLVFVSLRMERQKSLVKKLKQVGLFTLVYMFLNTCFIEYCYIIYFIFLKEKKTGETKVAILILSMLVVMCIPIIGAAGKIR